MHTRHLAWICLSLAMIVPPAVNSSGQPTQEVHGASTNGLEPVFWIQKSGTNLADWFIEVDLVAHANFAPHTWLKVLDRTSSRLELWTTDDVQVKATAAATVSVPGQTTVSNIMAAVYRRYRGSQWWPGGMSPTPAGEYFHLSGFDLRSVFDIPFTNDMVLQITPMIYKVDTNQVSARLVEFPPTKLKLLANGDVQKAE